MKSLDPKVPSNKGPLMKILPAVLVVLAASATAAADDFIAAPKVPASQPTSAPATATAPATAPAEPVKLAGLTFVSVDKHEVGRGVGGPAMGTWSLRFSDKTVSWHYSDVVESLKYTVTADGKIEATSAMRNGAKRTGQYDAATKELTFDGAKYKQQ
jgi:hypothetical protein